MNRIFEIKDEFYLDGEKIKIISGSIHYFRVVPEYWMDRLLKLKAMGCNTVETYVPWNMHEPEEGKFCFEGKINLEKFIKMAGDIGLMVIVRPSPFICAEWEFGGMPAWLLTKEQIRLRTDNPVFLEYVDRYYQKLFQILAPLQCTCGGPVIMMQIENEYGYYGNDKSYLNKLKNMMIKYGANVPFVTSDGPTRQSLTNGSLEGVLATGNFGSQAVDRFGEMKKFIGDKPLMCMEFWAGWFDTWNCGEHHVSDLEENKKDLDDMLRLGNVNFYMFQGGTNFGFMNGANYYACLEPDVTSYDYDAVLTEDGQITEKYKAFKEIIGKYTEIPEVELPAVPERRGYGELTYNNAVSLFEVLKEISSPVTSPYTISMEEAGQNYGYILYRTFIHNKEKIEKFRLLGAADRAVIYTDYKKADIRYDKELSEEKELKIISDGEDQTCLDILVENMGRVNFGEYLEEQKKGIRQGVLINGAYQHGWEIYTLSLDNQIDKIDFSKKYKEGTAAFYRFEFEADETGDTFLDLSEWGKGCVFVNGHNIGRFWSVGPQKRLYIPAPYLKKNKNEIIVFETDGVAAKTVSLCAEPDLG